MRKRIIAAVLLMASSLGYVFTTPPSLEDNQMFSGYLWHSATD